MADILSKSVKTPAGNAPVVPVLLMSFGFYLTWFAVRYWRSDTAWPSDPVKAVLTGQPIPVPDRSSGQAAIGRIVRTAQGGGAGGVIGHSPGAGPTAEVMSKDQIKALWTGNGGSPARANMAAAIAMQESSGRTGITSPNPDGGTNVGLWQLDTKGVGAGHTVEQLADPATNCRITIMGSANGTNWSRWAAFTSGAYKKYL